MEKNEEWRPIRDYKDYFISSLGRVKSNKCWHGKQSILLKVNHAPIYSGVNLCKDGKVKRRTIHRLVANAFLPNPNKLPFVNHKNGIKKDNRLENLEWCTPLENISHAVKTGLWDFKGEKCHLAKVNWEQVRQIRARYRKGNTTYEKLGREFGIAKVNIGKIILNKTWVV